MVLCDVGELAECVAPTSRVLDDGARSGSVILEFEVLDEATDVDLL